jgi:hypothetical protein
MRGPSSILERVEWSIVFLTAAYLVAHILVWVTRSQWFQTLRILSKI